MNLKIIIGFILLALLSCENEKNTSVIKDGNRLIHAIYNKHKDVASKYITFDQKTIFYDTLGKVTKDEYWYEAISRPGKLHFRFGDFSTGNGFMYNDGHLYFMKDHVISNEKVDKFNEWTVLCHDVYVQPPEKTIDIVKNKFNINLNLIHEETWENRAIYVVGAKAGDLNSEQFWVDKERLYMVRNISLRDDGRLADIRYVNYKKYGNEWIEGGLIVLYDGKLYLEEFYENTKTHVNLDKALFKPENFSKTTSFFN